MTHQDFHTFLASEAGQRALVAQALAALGAVEQWVLSSDAGRRWVERVQWQLEQRPRQLRLFDVAARPPGKE